MISKFPKVKQYYSFESNVYGRPYKLFEVEDTIVEKFHNLLEKLDNQPQTILCTRGDSKLDSDTDEHNNFFDEELSKVFIVGTKARYNQHSENQEIYDHTTVNHKINLLHELKQLINLTNEAMNTRGIENSEEELEYFNSSFFEKLSTLEMETLEKWKIFFLSFHHTDGRLQEFNSNSPFLSMTEKLTTSLDSLLTLTVLTSNFLIIFKSIDTPICCFTMSEKDIFIGSLSNIFLPSLGFSSICDVLLVLISTELEKSLNLDLQLLILIRSPN